MRRNRVRICTTSIVAITAVAAQAVPAPAFTINVAGGRVGGYVAGIGEFRPPRDPSLAAAKRAFGQPSSHVLTSEHSCEVRWKRLKLMILFANFGLPGPGQTVCSDRGGFAQTFRARGPRFRTWNGLRVGHRESRIADLHPLAEYRDGRWWLKSTRSIFGDGGQFPVVDATVGRSDRVHALSGWIGAAGD